MEEPQAPLRCFRLRGPSPPYIDTVRIQYHDFTGGNVPLLDVVDVERGLPPLGIMLRGDRPEGPLELGNAPDNHRVRAIRVLARALRLYLTLERRERTRRAGFHSLGYVAHNVVNRETTHLSDGDAL